MNDLALIGWHGAHNEEALQGCADLKAILRAMRGLRNRYVLADSNVDFLSSGEWRLDDAPIPRPRWCEAENELMRHVLEDLVETVGMQVLLPGEVRDSPGGPWGSFARWVPVTRLPQGLAAEYSWPSLLDIAIVPEEVEMSLMISWLPAIADHTALFLKLPPV